MSPTMQRRRRRVHTTNDKEPTSSSYKTPYGNEADDEADTREVLVIDPTEIEEIGSVSSDDWEESSCD